METEKWREIPGYEGLYEVSTFGRIRNARTQNIIAPFDTGHGYSAVKLQKNRFARQIKVHRAVALAFLPNPYNKPQVNHIDSNRKNNNVENLEWCTPSENMRHSCDRGFSFPVGSKPVVQMDTEGNKVAVWSSISEAARALQTYPANIHANLIGKTKHCKGFKWRWATYRDVYPQML